MSHDQPLEPAALRPPRGPTREQVERMSPAERQRLEYDLAMAYRRYKEAVMASLSAEERLAMAEAEEVIAQTCESLRVFFGCQVPLEQEAQRERLEEGI